MQNEKTTATTFTESTKHIFGLSIMIKSSRRRRRRRIFVTETPSCCNRRRKKRIKRSKVAKFSKSPSICSDVTLIVIVCPSIKLRHDLNNSTLSISLIRLSHWNWGSSREQNMEWFVNFVSHLEIDRRSQLKRCFLRLRLFSFLNLQFSVLLRPQKISMTSSFSFRSDLQIRRPDLIRVTLSL